MSFSISAPGLDPNQVTEGLGLTPDHSHLQGDYPNKNPRHSPYKHGMWLLNSKISPDEPLSAHLERLLSVLEPKQEQILRLSEENDVNFGCDLFGQIGFQLASDVLKRIANLGAALGMTVYAPDSVNENDSSR